MTTRIDEYGDTGILQQPYENRRDGCGRKLGPKPPHLAQLPYDRKKIESPIEPRVDEQGNAICGP